ncbi:MAG TPA: quinone oxidoreductase, partial [Candidatus Hodarchaeales archaeon]|nr:quinone oxidoreductase [Candidatus Hodarchaeales archaeon]
MVTSSRGIDQMRAVRIHTTGGTEVLKLDEVPEPSPAQNQVKVQIKSIGVNFIDVYHRTGLYKRDLPIILGEEAAGIVAQVGTGTKGFKVGDRVAYAVVGGSYADYSVVPAEKLALIPDKITFEQAAASILQGLTAHYLAKSTYKVKKGDRLLIHSGAGGVGLLLVQICKSLGAFVIATVSSDEKKEIVRKSGADLVINYETTDFVKAVKEATNNQGVHVVFDSVGKTTFLRGLDCLIPRGYMVLFGQSSGVVEPFNPGLLAQKGSLFLTRPTLGHYI